MDALSINLFKESLLKNYVILYNFKFRWIHKVSTKWTELFSTECCV